MPIAKFDPRALPSGFATKRKFFKIDTRDGAVGLIDMTCKHRGGPLTHGTCIDGSIVCPWHRQRSRRATLERELQPSVTTSDQVLFVVDSAPTRVFHALPLDPCWEK